MAKLRKFLPLGLMASAASALAEGESAATATLPTGIHDAVESVQDTADLIAAEVVPAVAYIGLAFLGVAVCWFLVRLIRKGLR